MFPFTPPNLVLFLLGSMIVFLIGSHWEKLLRYMHYSLFYSAIITNFDKFQYTLIARTNVVQMLLHTRFIAQEYLLHTQY